MLIAEGPPERRRKRAFMRREHSGRAGGGNAAPPAPEGEFRILRRGRSLYARDNREGAMGFKTILVHFDAGRGTTEPSQDRRSIWGSASMRT